MARHRPIPPHRRSALAPALLAAALAVSGCIAGDVPDAPAGDAQLVTGRTLWAANCVSCHGSDGGGGRGSKLNEGRLVERYPDPAEQYAIVAEGRRAMPGFAEKLTEAELEAVVRYTREIIAAQ